MRVDCEKWIFTTLKEHNSTKETHTTTPGHFNLVSSANQNKLIVEQKIQLDQQLYSDSSSDTEEQSSSKKGVAHIVHNVQNYKEQNINFEIINDGSLRIKMFEADTVSDINSKTSNSLNTSTDSSSSYCNEISHPLKTISYQLVEHEQQKVSWQSFQSLLDKSLDVHCSRETFAIVQECLKLENYLENEFQLDEKMIYFSSQKDVVTYLNKTLKKKLFSLSRSTELFNQQKKELNRILTAKLSTANLSNVLSNFEELERDYYKLVESIKSRLKLRIAKLENHVELWAEFESTCRILDGIYEENKNSMETTNLEYLGILSEISNYLKSLKDNLSTLSSTCSESKYFEMKNQIISHEIKFNQIRTEHETAKQQFHLRYFTNTNEYDEKFESYTQNSTQKTPVISKSNHRNNNDNNNLRNRNFHSINSVNNMNYPKTPQTEKVYTRPRLDIKQIDMSKFHQRVETCDKSTFTVNEIATQTEQQFQLNHQFYSLDSHHNHSPQFSNSKQNYHHQHIINKENVNNNKHNSMTSTESDGKKLLLEAYLRNNENNRVNLHLDNSHLESSRSSNSGLLLTTSKQLMKRKSLTTTGTRESGIGTFDDELANSSCDLEFHKVLSQKEKALDSQTDDNESTCTNEDYYINNKITIKNKTQKQNQSVNSTRPAISNEQKTLEPSTIESTKTGWFYWFFRTFFMFFVIFLALISVLFSYLFYSVVLNPGCCDYQRNYLMFNVS